MTTNPKDLQEIDLEKRYGPLTFAKLLVAHREAEQLSQAELAKLLGISRQKLCDYEKGRRLPSPAKACEFSEKLGMHPAVLVEIVLQEWLRQEHLDFKVSVA